MITFPSWDKSAHWVRVYRARIRCGLEKCRICGCLDVWGTAEQLTLDHIQARSKGGTSLMENATILCARCNGEKADRDAVFRISLVEEERSRPHRERWSKHPVPVVPHGPWDEPGSRQPPRTKRGHRRALENALPAWARPYYADFAPGEIPDHVKRIIASRYACAEHIPHHVRRLMESG
jgi:hypothetical protein